MVSQSWHVSAGVAALAVALLAGGTEGQLIEYVRQEDGAFQWRVESKFDANMCTVYDLHLVSQEWKGIKWEHQLLVYEPKQMKYKDVALLFISGGRTGRKANPAEMAVAMMLAQLCQARCALLRQVPNQPLFNNLFEDAAIAETFLRFMDTEDGRWPLLLPMTKSAVRAMDAVQQLAKRSGGEVKRFVVTGASKRGWTTWLTAAADSRVAAIAPMVIDVLNINKQLPHQLEVWGKYSEQINDYVETGLVEQLDTPRGRKLLSIVDPYSHRERIKQPKFIIIGTNDRYWTLDALDIYWNDLLGPKYVIYVPNAGHGLDENRHYAVNGVAALVRHVGSGQALPELSWSWQSGSEGLTLTVRSNPAAKEAWFWTASTPTRDFRQSHWRKRPMQRSGDGWIGQLARPEKGRVAALGDLVFEIDGLRYHLSTQIAQVAGSEATAPKASSNGGK
jgi:PhoPQ-activated pathogenicity-related protein